MKELSVEVFSPYKVIWKGLATYVRVPSPSGQFGVLPGHQPFVSLLAAGYVHITCTDNTKIAIPVQGGFVFINGTKATILPDNDGDALSTGP